MTDYSLYAFPLLTGVVIALVTQIVAYFLSKRNIDAQREYSLNLAKMQLYHQDRKDAIIKLDELLKKNYKTYPLFRDAINAFLDGSSGLFLPKKLKTDLKKELSDINAFLEKEEEAIYGPPPENPFDEEEYNSWFADLSPDEQLDIQLTSKLSALKGTMTKKIEKHFSDE